MQESLVKAPTHEQVLQLATERQVHAFDLSEKFKITIGRHSSNDVQLRSMRVSSYHAEILSEVDGLVLKDMGSTNGTLVNDETVRQHRLVSGDCIRIGNFSISVRLLPRMGASLVAGTSRSEPFPVGTLGNVLPFCASAKKLESVTSPDGLDLTLPDLLARLAAEGATRTVVLRNQSEQGRIYVVEGAVLHAEAGVSRREKALFRLLALQKGTYEIVELAEPESVPKTIDAPTPSLVIEGMQQIEMIEALSSQLPPVVYEVALDGKCDIPVSRLDPEEIAIYEALVRYRTIVRVLEDSELSDFNVLRLVLGLLRKGFFRVTSTKGGRLEQTSFTGPGPKLDQ